MPRRLGPKTRIRLALRKVQAEISGHASRGDNTPSGQPNFASGLASEGYCGGYADALMDVELVLNGNIPSRRDYWEVKDA